MNYWGYRIDKSRIGFFMDELNNGRLRQGWGWDDRQNLRDIKMDEGAKRNLPMFNKVKEGDILFIPQLPSWGEVAIVKATEDWGDGYQFEIHQEYGDYGHIFPAKFIKSFTRSNENVTGNIRSTLRNPSRFWNIRYTEDSEILLKAPQDSLKEKQDHYSRLTSSVGEVFNEVFNDQNFTDKIYDKLNEQFTAEEWEFALAHGLQELCPFYQIERVGGNKEKSHGTDILIKLPSPLGGDQYAIAIQVKDHEGKVSKSAIDQINKADDYWQNEGLKLIDKWLIITKAPKDSNNEIENNESGVEVIFANKLKALLSRIAKNMITME